VVWGGALTLLGHGTAARQSFAPGDSLSLELLWWARRRLTDDWSVRLWLERAGQRYGERSYLLGGGYPAPAWSGIAPARQWPDYALPANLPDGDYTLYLGVSRAGVAQRGAPAVTLGGLGGVFGSERLALRTLTVKGRPRAFAMPAVAQTAQIAFGPAITLAGWDAPAEAIAGQTLDVRLVWKAAGVTDQSYAVFVHLVNAAGQIVAQHDGLPGLGALPTSGWAAGEFVDDHHPLALPASLPAGQYTLNVGLYDPISGARLPAAGADHVALTEVTIP
jgi:hypothetical protein